MKISEAETTRDIVRALGETVNAAFNGNLPPDEEHTGFFLLVFPVAGKEKESPVAEGARYVSNMERESGVAVMRFCSAHLAGWPNHPGGHA